jgi:hypothetical protein
MKRKDCTSNGVLPTLEKKCEKKEVISSLEQQMSFDFDIIYCQIALQKS